MLQESQCAGLRTGSSEADENRSMVICPGSSGPGYMPLSLRENFQNYHGCVRRSMSGTDSNLHHNKFQYTTIIIIFHFQDNFMESRATSWQYGANNNPIRQHLLFARLP
jgi:hypothetical protein